MGREELEEAGPLDASEYLAAVVLGLVELLLDDTGLPALDTVEILQRYSVAPRLLRLGICCLTFNDLQLYEY